MKRSLLRISAAGAVLALIIFSCKGSVKRSGNHSGANGSSDSNGAVSQVHQSDSAQGTIPVKDSLDYMKDSKHPEQTTPKEIPAHSAPDQETIDSLKEVKTRSKQKPD